MIRRQLVLATVLAITVAACGEDESTDTLLIYTSVTQATVDAVTEEFQAASPDAQLEVFRAPTGELAARIAAEQREGGLQADVLWLSDPLSIEQYARDGILRTWEPNGIESIRDEFRTSTSFGTRLLNMVIVAGNDLPNPPADWSDLPSLTGPVALPDPAFAGSAFGALGFFAVNPDYGMAFYENLAANGAVEVQTPGDVVNGVAEGQFEAGMSLDFTVRGAVNDGSPVELIWPTSGAISIYSPIAVVDDTSSRFAEAFVEFTISTNGQEAIAQTGWQPVRDDTEWPFDGLQQSIDWTAAFDRQAELLSTYQDIFDR